MLGIVLKGISVNVLWYSRPVGPNRPRTGGSAEADQNAGGAEARIRTPANGGAGAVAAGRG